MKLMFKVIQLNKDRGPSWRKTPLVGAPGGMEHGENVDFDVCHRHWLLLGISQWAAGKHQFFTFPCTVFAQYLLKTGSRTTMTLHPQFRYQNLHGICT